MDPTARRGRVLRDDPVTNVDDAYGSFLVYRKLHQDVGLFEEGVKELADDIPMTEELTGAMLAGRFKDGTPVVRPRTPRLADVAVTNDFNYFGDDAGFECLATPISARSTHGSAVSLADLLRRRCRKRRIVRRGVPDGRARAAACARRRAQRCEPQRRSRTAVPVLQADIESQFEFIQRTWVDGSRISAWYFALLEEHRLRSPDRPGERRRPALAEAMGRRADRRTTISFKSAVDA